MSSPVKVRFHSFIKIDRNKADPVFMQIVYQFINAVRRSLLEDGDRLPGSRKIADDLQVHRKTVVAAIQELQEQGWVKSLPNIGTFVKDPESTSDIARNSRASQHPPDKAAFTFKKDFILNNPVPEHPENLYFTDGTPDYSVVKADELVRFYAGAVRRTKELRAWQYTSEGNPVFGDQLSFYLNLTRRFHLSRSFLLPIASREQVFSILSHLLIHPGDVILIEALSYYLPNMIFNQAGAKLKIIPVDEDGMNVDYIRENFKPGEIRCVYLNPRSQYPTGVPLSEKRKIQLLQLAEQFNFFVIEDDADFEFSMSKEKEATLFRKDGGQRVIYVGTFGGFLAPGFQMNFLLAPKDLIEEARKYLNLYGKPNILMEKALGDIIHQGDIHRYQRKSHRVISERKNRFAQLLELYFKNSVSFRVPPSSLAFWIRFNHSISLSRLQEKARERGLLIPGICLYQNRNITALRLGYAHLNPQVMEEAVIVLAQAYREIENSNSN